jgi:lipopolysaccharide biosynthesis glycosyltransferase
MRIAFVYVTDERGFDLATQSALSLALSQRRPCDIHIFCYRFRPVLSPQLSRAFEALNGTLTLDVVSDAAVERHQTCGHVTTPTLLKISILDKLVRHYDRIVYLDNDILVFDDLSIEAVAFGDAPIAAVVDMDLSDTGVMRDTWWARRSSTDRGMRDYFNAGLLIFEARNWRHDEFHGRYAAALDQHDVSCGYKVDCTSIDQCALNSVFQDNWVKLPATYNMQAGAKFTRSWQVAAVRHYCGPRKFIPVAMFRNDLRDIRVLNRIRDVVGLPRLRLPVLYEISFWINRIRHYPSAGQMRRFLRAAAFGEAQGEHAAGARPG